MSITKLKHLLPLKVYDELEECFNKYGISDATMIAHFMAQVSHESGSFKMVYENLNYSISGLLKIFPKYFNDAKVAAQYARNPKKIANKVYANRMGNGDENSGDGYKFRGRGYLQVTGKDAYSKFSKFIGEDCVNNPDLIAVKYPIHSAFWFFNERKIWDRCKKSDHESVVAVTKLVNGGVNGLADRLVKFKMFMNALK